MPSKYDDIYVKVRNSVEKTSKKIDELDNPLKIMQEKLENKCFSLSESIEDGEANQVVFDEYNNALSYLNVIIDQRKNLTESEIKNNKLYVDTLKILSSIEKEYIDGVSADKSPNFISLEDAKERLKKVNKK